MWEKGARKVAVILPIKIHAINSICFENSVVSEDLLDISLIKYSELPQTEFVEESRGIKKLLKFVHKIIPRSPLDTDPSKQRLPDACQNSKNLVETSQEMVMKRLETTFDVDEISLLDTVTDFDYVYTKINHRCWEEVTNLGLNHSGKKYIRKMGPIDHDCVASKFYECLAICLITTARAVSGKPRSGHQLRLCNSNFSFGIGLTGGNASFVDDLRGQGRDAKIINNIYSSVTIGAAAGLLGFFSSLAQGDHRWLVADGSAPKALFWNGQFGRFIKGITESSDAILFIVPPWFSDVTIADALGVKVFKLVVPGENIDSMWSLVAPVVLQHIAELASKYRLTVLSQCSVVSAVIGMMLNLYLKTSKHRSPCRFYDLGQLLDLVNIDGTNTGFWLTRKDVREHAFQTDDWSNLLCLSEFHRSRAASTSSKDS